MKVDATKATARRPSGMWILAIIGGSLGICGIVLLVFGKQEVVAIVENYDEIGTRVRGNIAVTNHSVAPVFGSDELIIRAELPVSNWWAKSVHFAHVIPTCSCMKAELARDTLAPGEETVLKMEVKLPPEGGRRKIACALVSQTGEKAIHNFYAIGYSYVHVDSRAGIISLGDLAPSSPIESITRFFLNSLNSADGIPSLIEATSDSPEVTPSFGSVSEAKTLQAGEGIQATSDLKLQVKPSSLPGSHGTTIYIRYRIGEVVYVKPVSVIWQVRRILSADPERLFFTVNPSESGDISRTITVASSDGNPFIIRSIRSSESWVDCRALSQTPSTQQQFAIQIHPVRAPDNAFVDLEIDTDHPLQPSIRFPVSLRTRSEAETTEGK